MYQTFILNTGLFIIGIVFGVQLYITPSLPEFDLDRWWGPGNKPEYEDTSIRPFKITFNDSMVYDLRARLQNRRPFTPPLEGIQSEFGLNTIYFDKVLRYWQHEYNFKEREDRLNRFAHFKTRIQGLDLHFIREYNPNVKGLKVIPLLLIHGWPSSSKEFDMVIPLLTKPRQEYDFVFDVVAVDLPGFGFSEGASKPGLSPVQMAIVLRNFMRRLGFNQFCIQAGDWGSQVATHMVTIFQDEIIGFHTNMPFSSMPISIAKFFIASLFPRYFVEEKYVKRISLREIVSLILQESGYYHLQATKPDTIGAALTDNPSGMAAYILERVGAGSNREQMDTPHGGMENIDIDDLLDTATIMWANDRIATSMRIYAEAYTMLDVNFETTHTRIHSIPTKVPTAAIYFLYEIVYQPDWILRDKFPNLLRSTSLDFGGHFAGMHTPTVLADDVFAAVDEFIKFHENVIS